MNKTVKKYLKTYAETEVNYLNKFPSEIIFKNSVVIPAYNENDAFFCRFIDSDLSASNFFEKINVKQTENKLVQGLMQQHIALTSYSDLLFHTTRLKNRISKETEIAIQALKN